MVYITNGQVSRHSPKYTSTRVSAQLISHENMGTSRLFIGSMMNNENNIHYKKSFDLLGDDIISYPESIKSLMLLSGPQKESSTLQLK